MVLLLAGLLTVLSVVITITRFKIDTNMTDLLAKHLPYHELDREYHRDFPAVHETIVVVVRAAQAKTLQQSTHALKLWLNRHPALYHDLYQPGGGSFFRKNGLLYLSSVRLRKLLDRIDRAEPVVAHLALDPTASGFFSMLTRSFDHLRTLAPLSPQYARLLDLVSESVQATLRGHAHPLPWSRLLAGRGKAQETPRPSAILIVKPRAVPGALRPYETAIDRLQYEISRLESRARTPLHIGLTGGAVLDDAQLHSATSGIDFATLLSLLAIITILLLGLRRLKPVLAVLLTLLVSLVWTVAFALVALGPFNLISISFAVLFIGLGVDFGIQFSIRYLEESQSNPGISSALERTVLSMGLPLSLAALAAAISFFSFVPTQYAGIISLGLIAGVSMFISLAATLTLLPALVQTFGVRAGPPRPGLRIGRFLHVRRNGPWISGLFLVLGLAAVYFVTQVRFDFNPLNLENPNSAPVRTFRQLVARSRFSPYSIDVMEPGLAAARQLQKRLDHLPTVRMTVSAASFIPSHQHRKLAWIRQAALLFPPFFMQARTSPTQPAQSRQSIHDFLKATGRIHLTGKLSQLARPLAQLRGILEQFLRLPIRQEPRWNLLETNLMGSFPTALHQLEEAFQAQPVTLARLPTSLRTRYLNRHGIARVQVFSRLNLNHLDLLRHFVRQVTEAAPRAIGTPVMLVDGGNAVLGAFRQATVTAFVGILLLLFWVLRDIRHTVLALAPMILTILLASATMRLWGISYNMANIIVLPLLMGLSVAYGIYFIVRWREGYDLDLVLGTSTARGILVSGLATLSAFGSLALSSDRGISILGQTLSIVMAWVLVSTLVALPAILSLLPDRKQPVDHPAPE